MDNQHRLELIQHSLTAAFHPQHLTIIDESHKHAGHAGAREGKGHFKLIISKNTFPEKTLVEIHRLIYKVLGSLMQTEIHALTIELI